MRIIAIMLLLSICTISNAQLAKESGFYTFHKAIRQDGTKAEIYDHALSWVHDHFEENRCGLVKYKSQERGKIIVEGSWDHVNGGTPGKIGFTLLIVIRGGVYRETYKEFSYKTGNKTIPFESKKLSKRNKIMVDVNSLIRDYSDDLINSMSHYEVATM